MITLTKIAVAIVVYVAIVFTFESLLGLLQPSAGSTLVITTVDGSGGERNRVLSRLTSDGELFVAANHWPRAWYRRALANPDVFVSVDGDPLPYRAVPATPEEHDRVNGENRHGIVFKLLTGFPPRRFLRLEPR